jgi:hypothetical protein
MREGWDESEKAAGDGRFREGGKEGAGVGGGEDVGGMRRGVVGKM